ncbi:MAG: Gfo/Idh/MocA family oxidoreductase [Pirellulales bacterium]|nr:Gfo/Idh/MocA family oxidoreductase [Pirellulales bacterium]
MNEKPNQKSTDGSRATSRRTFLKKSTTTVAGAALLGGMNLSRSAHAKGSDQFKIALIGCGGRGTGAAIQALSTKANVKLIAMADAFEDKVNWSHDQIKKAKPDRVDVPKERRFSGLDAYKKATETDADVVVICTPPGFRPMQFEAAVKAGKHIFMEKPLAVDGPGIRKILDINKEAKKKNLLVAVGFHMRHEPNRIEIVKKLHEGAIGDIKFFRAYFNSNGVWVRPRQPEQTEMQYQVNNWYYFNWLSGDHIVEQHVHDLDICNWVKGGHPVKANGMGGRQFRIGKDYGEIFDHHSVEFEYADGTRLFSYCRHIPNCWSSFSQHAHGTKGEANMIGHGNMKITAEGKDPIKWRRGSDGHQIEHDDLFAALLAGKHYNECDSSADSSMTAILGRMATYSGKIVTWEDAMNSKLDLSPDGYAWNSTPQPKPGPEGIYPCAMPGITKAF